jgi:Membrane transport protein
VGVYLHRRGFIKDDDGGQRTLALMSQQVTVPLFLFTKTIHCPSDLRQVLFASNINSNGGVFWILLFGPAMVVTMGIIVGAVVALICATPREYVKTVMAAVGFANSTGLPITLLSTLVHTTTFSESSSVLGARIDPTIYLSVYLILFPVLQWGIGGWLLAPCDEDDDEDRDQKFDEESKGDMHSKGDLIRDHSVVILGNMVDSTASPATHRTAYGATGTNSNSAFLAVVESASSSFLVASTCTSSSSLRYMPVEQSPLSSRPDCVSRVSTLRDMTSPNHMASVWDTIQTIGKRSFQPPVAGALAGFAVAMFPQVRGIFVDVVDRGSHAPLQWFFDALYSIGLTAVPINMILLGCNLSAAAQALAQRQKEKQVCDGLSSSTSSAITRMPFKTMVGIVIGKMIVMPSIGLISTMILKCYILDLPQEIAGAFYLVLLIVFLTPTANNVMVMVELAASSRNSASDATTKESIASVIALQYACAPMILACTMTIAIGKASSNCS